MYKNSTWRTSKVCTSKLNQSAIIWKIFTKYKFNLYKELYKNLPENTLPNKLIKLRYINNIEREELSRILNLHLDTLEGWELHNVMPSPKNVLKLSEFFRVPLEYFDEYYNIYFDSPGTKIKKWKEKNKFTYKQATNILNITHSSFGRLINGKINLSYDMYLKLKKLGAFS